MDNHILKNKKVIENFFFIKSEDKCHRWPKNNIWVADRWGSILIFKASYKNLKQK